MLNNFFKKLSIESSGFGDYNHRIVEHILANIANHMDMLIPSPAQSMDVTISFPPPDIKHPMCVSFSKSRHILLQWRNER